MDYDTLLGPRGKLQLCTYLERYGLAFIRGVETSEGMVEKVGNYIGHVRVTNYGAVFDVKDVGSKATNLAFTNQKICAHTDNPYRDPFPGVQMLHCLSNASEGGATLFTDGFRVAEELKLLDQDAFHLLSSIEHPFEYRDEDAKVLLQASVPVLKLRHGKLERVTFNNRSAAALSAEMSELERYYQAWALFDRLANSMDFTVRAHLKLGWCLRCHFESFEQLVPSCQTGVAFGGIWSQTSPCQGCSIFTFDDCASTKGLFSG